MTNKEHFKVFSQQHKELLPFSLTYDWWFEVVANSWDVAVVLKDDKPVAIWPYFLRKKGPWEVIAPAYFTPYAGPFLSYPKDQKPSTKISYEHKTHQSLIDQLPKVAEIEQQFHLNFKNGLAFRWNGFIEQINYTYILDLHDSQEVLWSNLRENIKRQIRKAEKGIKLQKRHDASKILEALFKETFKEKGTNYPIGDNKIVQRLVDYIEKYKKGNILFAEDNEGETHAGNACVYDQQTAHYLIGGSAADFRNSAATSLLMWHQILSAKAAGCRYFNFEGSVIPAVEQFLRGFGGSLQSVHRIHKTSSKSLELVKKAKSAI